MVRIGGLLSLGLEPVPHNPSRHIVRTRLCAACVGFTDGQTVMVIASPKADVQRAKASRDDSRMLSIAEELARSARRAQRAGGAAGPPAGEFTFGDYRALPIAAIPGASPGEDKALQLLHRLAADAGIVGIMRQNKCALQSPIFPPCCCTLHAVCQSNRVVCKRVQYT